MKTDMPSRRSALFRVSKALTLSPIASMGRTIRNGLLLRSDIHTLYDRLRHSDAGSPLPGQPKAQG